MNLHLTDEQKQLIIELHKTADGKKKFAGVLKNNVCKQLDQQSMLRQLLRVEKLEYGAVPKLCMQPNDKFYFITNVGNEIKVECTVNTDKLYMPQIEISTHETVSLRRSDVGIVLNDLDVRIFKEIQRSEFALFLKLLKAYYEECDDEMTLPIDVKDFKLILSSNGQSLNNITRNMCDTNAKFITVDFLEAGEYFAIKDLSGAVLISAEECLPADDPSTVSIGYVYYQNFSIACRFEGIKLIDQEIWDNTHIDKFKFIMNN
jgi:hypothetical protein